MAFFVHADSIPFLSPVAAAAPLQPAGAAGGGESGAAPPAAGIVIAGKGPTRGDQLANAAVCGSINAIIAVSGVRGAAAEGLYLACVQLLQLVYPSRQHANPGSN